MILIPFCIFIFSMKSRPTIMALVSYFMITVCNYDDTHQLPYNKCMDYEDKALGLGWHNLCISVLLLLLQLIQAGRGGGFGRFQSPVISRLNITYIRSAFFIQPKPACTQKQVLILEQLHWITLKMPASVNVIPSSAYRCGFTLVEKNRGC